MNARDRRDVADEIEIELVVERRVDRVVELTSEQRIAVRRRAHDRLGGDIAASTRPVLDDEWLAEPLRQPLTDQPREDVGRPPAAKPTIDAHRPRRIGLRPCDRATRPAARQRPRPDARIVFGGEVSSSPLRLAKVHSSAHRAPGRRTVKAEPLPGSLVTVTSPPIMRASLRLTERPRPVLPKRCAVGLLKPWPSDLTPRSAVSATREPFY